MDYVRILHFMRILEEFEQIGFAAFVIDLSSSHSSTSSSSSEAVPMAKVYSHFTEHIVEYSDSEDHTSRVKYSSLEPSFLDRDPSVKNDPICSWKMHETKSSVATAQMGMGRNVPKTTPTRFKTLGHKLRDTYIGPRTRKQTSERIFTIPIKVAVILGVSTVGKIF
ncbi:hypothetical protein ACOSQ2_014300 [Xanthoceras sorbifolium]